MTPIQRLIDGLMREYLKRDSQLERDATLVRKWRDEDLREGVVWDD